MLPGALGGSIIGLIFAGIYWSSEAAPVCGANEFGIRPDCVKVAIGAFTSMTGFAVACMAIAGIIGTIVNFVAARETPA